VESAIVQSYRSDSPGALSWKWRPKSSRRRAVTLSMLLMTILSVLSSDQQKAIIHILQPLAITGLGFGFAFVQSHPVLFVIPGLLMLVAGYYFVNAIRSQKNFNDIFPLANEPQDTPIHALRRSDRGENKSDESLELHSKPSAAAPDPFLGVIPEEGVGWSGSGRLFVDSKCGVNYLESDDGGIEWNSSESSDYPMNNDDALNEVLDVAGPLFGNSNSSEGGSVMPYVASIVSSRPNSNDISLFLPGHPDDNFDFPSEEDIRPPSVSSSTSPLATIAIDPLDHEASSSTGEVERARAQSFPEESGGSGNGIIGVFIVENELSSSSSCLSLQRGEGDISDQSV
jgi:hypothetical protein